MGTSLHPPLVVLGAATLLFAAPVLGLACDYPDRPTLPDGSTASKEDMIAAQSDVKAFLAAVDEYLDCIEQEEKDAIAALPEIDESDEEAVAGRAQVRAELGVASTSGIFRNSRGWPNRPDCSIHAAG